MTFSNLYNLLSHPLLSVYVHSVTQMSENPCNPQTLACFLNMYVHMPPSPNSNLSLCTQQKDSALQL